MSLLEVAEDFEDHIDVTGLEADGRFVYEQQLGVHDHGASDLKWQHLKPYEKFAEMIDRHWDGIAAFRKPENKVPLGFVEGLNNKIRLIQRRSYDLRDKEYLCLKVLTCMLPEI